MIARHKAALSSFEDAFPASEASLIHDYALMDVDAPRVDFYVDGAYRPKGAMHGIRHAKAVAACVLKNTSHSRGHNVWIKVLPDKPPPTNTRAEITAVILAQETALTYRKNTVTKKRQLLTIHSDCRTTVEHLNGVQISRQNKDLLNKAVGLDKELRRFPGFSVTYTWIPRGENKLADSYCTVKLDEVQEINKKDLKQKAKIETKLRESKSGRKVALEKRNLKKTRKQKKEKKQIEEKERLEKKLDAERKLSAEKTKTKRLARKARYEQKKLDAKKKMETSERPMSKLEMVVRLKDKQKEDMLTHKNMPARY
ncbi:hypothetical protein BT63DRAFT_413933 [Microthyrium microscopicum]|uniref:RNase H type-1 domain-containing protein n=1 Tax=Microthyrium microscopicum TaxID=703497 RepID=A0A6A6UD55_9PEZI|nr:hypothetical protein BT63DRAFT_413933 [Microthyrium microscopicum]